MNILVLCFLHDRVLYEASQNVTYIALFNTYMTI